MSAPREIVVVGAGLAGAKAAEALRAEGWDGRLTLVGDEDERPYERPPLSKGVLRGEAEPASADVHPPGFYEDHDIALLTGAAVERIDLGARAVVLSGGARLSWDRLLLATGAAPRALPVPGAGLPGVLALRTRADCARLRDVALGGGRLVVVGAGWIGCEAAASARALGMDVTMVEAGAQPLAGVLGPQIGAFYAALHRDNGVELLTGSGVEAIEGAGRAERVRLAGGRLVECAAVLVGVGVAPRTALAEEAGLTIDNGIAVDATLRASADGVYAAGDVASAEHPLLGRRVRVEHWANALNQGPAAARNMLGADERYERLPYFFSDQYDVGMEYSGLARGTDELVVRGDPAAREFVAFWLDGGRVAAAMNVNVWGVTDALQALIRSRAAVEPARLRDPDVPLEALAGPAA